MEKDGQTRVFISGNGNRTAWEMYPIERVYDDRLQDEIAQEVLSRADFVCVNSETFEKGKDGRFGKQLEKEWGVLPKPKGPLFRIDRMKIKREEEYIKLVEILENRTQKKRFDNYSKVGLINLKLYFNWRVKTRYFGLWILDSGQNDTPRRLLRHFIPRNDKQILDKGGTNP